MQSGCNSNLVAYRLVWCWVWFKQEIGPVCLVVTKFKPQSRLRTGLSTSYQSRTGPKPGPEQHNPLFFEQVKTRFCLIFFNLEDFDSVEGEISWSTYIYTIYAIVSRLKGSSCASKQLDNQLNNTHCQMILQYLVGNPSVNLLNLVLDLIGR